MASSDNILSTSMHYSCAPLIFILQTLAFAIQQKWNILSSALFIVGILLDIVYVIIIYGLPETSTNPAKVHCISKWCILTEFAALIIPSTSVVLFVYNL